MRFFKGNALIRNTDQPGLATRIGHCLGHAIVATLLVAPSIAAAQATAMTAATETGVTKIIDATRAKVIVSSSPRRIVALAPSLGELAADLLGPDLTRIVGVSEYTDYPPAIRKVKSIGPYHKFNIEAVVGLKPDLVLGTMDGNTQEQVLHLRELGVPVVVVNTVSFELIEQAIRIVGQALGNPREGERMAAQFATGISRIRGRAKDRPKLRVVMQVGDDPLVVAGKESFLTHALEAVGADNAYADLAATYPRPAIEDVLRRDPDLILVVALGPDSALYRKMAGKWARFPSLKAVRGKRTQVLQGDEVVRPTLRLLEGLSILERAIYGRS